MANEKLYTWRTKKVATGFESIVIELTPSAVELEDGTFCKSEIIKKYQITFPTRARAKSYAQRCCRYLKSIKA